MTNNEQIPETSSNKEMVNWLIHASSAILFACGGFILNLTFDGMEKMESKLDSIPHTYVSKVDYREDQHQIIQGLKDIVSKIDALAARTPNK